MDDPSRQGEQRERGPDAHRTAPLNDLHDVDGGNLDVNTDDAALVEAWRTAARDARVIELMRRLRAAIEEETRQRRPLCVASGLCCRFEAYGHRLYLTGLETAYVVDRLHSELGRIVTAGEVSAAVEGGTCPFLVDRLCGVHLVRPLGCRTYFCDPRTGDQFTALHERCHDEVRRIHETLAIPYRYGEWRAMLAMFAV